MKEFGKKDRGREGGRGKRRNRWSRKFRIQRERALLLMKNTQRLKRKSSSYLVRLVLLSEFCMQSASSCSVRHSLISARPFP